MDDIDAVRKFALKVWKYKEGELVSVMLHLGDRLDLFKQMAGRPANTAEQWAELTGLNHRWLGEWLYGMAAAGVLEHDDGRFALSDPAATVLAKEGETVFFAAGAFTETTPPAVIEQVASVMRSGGGFTYEEQGEAATLMTERMSAPAAHNFFLPVVIPAIPGLRDRLDAGCRVIEIGCGSGLTLTAVAAAFPNSTFVGVDPSPTAIARASEHAAELDNLQFIEGFAETDLSGAFDVAIALDTLHDMPFPDRALAAVRGCMAEDGVMLVKDIKTAQSFDDNLKNPVLAMQYGFSLVSCLASGLSEPGGLGLGTLGLNPALMAELASAAGFGSTVTHDLDDPTHLYYEIRP